jgi:hypothetical protein
MRNRRIGRKRGLFRLRRGKKRSGAAVLDYVLVLGVIMPLAAFVMWIGPRIMNLVYEMLGLLVSWPFM